MDTAWLDDLRQQKLWDDWVRGRPVCEDCGKEILEDRCLPWEGGFLCPRCVGRRMVEVEEL